MIKELSLEAYMDVDWNELMVDRRLTSCYYTFLGGNQVTRRSKKQVLVVRSSAKAKFKIMTYEICQLLWLKIVLKDLKVKWA